MSIAEQIKAMEDIIKANESQNEELNGKIEKLHQNAKSERMNLLLDAIIIGETFKARHGMIAPYSHGYYVSADFIKGYCEPVTGDNPWFRTLPERLYTYLTKKAHWTEDMFNELAVRVDAAWKAFPTSYNPDEYVPDSSQYLHGNHVANGYETDGFFNIVRGRCHGTYSSMTTTSQNDLSQDLIVLKGFCPDKSLHLANDADFKQVVSEVYARHEIDSDLSDLNEWAKRNPTRCGADSAYYQR